MKDVGEVEGPAVSKDHHPINGYRDEEEVRGSLY